MIKFSKKFTAGFTLLETFVALSIFTMSLLGILSILASGISNTNYAKQKIIAGYLAQEGIEHVRNVRDSSLLYSSDANAGWGAFLGSPGTSYPTDVPGFTRTITVDAGGSTNKVTVTSTVTWTQGSGVKSVILKADLYNFF